MSEEHSAEDRSLELIRDLAQDLEPVTPIPRLRTMMLGVLAVWGAVALVGVGVRGLRPDFLEMLLHMRGATLVFLGLALAGAGGLVAALAMGVPGRESAVRAGLLTSAIGLALAAGLGTLLFLQSPTAESVPWTADFHCLATALAVALIPALGIVLLGGRASVHRPLVLVLAAAAGMAALGGATSQAMCPADDLRHAMFGHVIAPGVGALVLALPLLVALRRASRL